MSRATRKKIMCKSFMCLCCSINKMESKNKLGLRGKVTSKNVTLSSNEEFSDSGPHGPFDPNRHR